MTTNGLGGLADGNAARRVLGSALNALLNFFEYDNQTVADTNAVALSDDGGRVQGLAIIFDITNAETALFFLDGQDNEVSLLGESDSNFAAAANGTDGQTNVYWSSGNSQYEVNNENGGDVEYEWMILRSPQQV